ncbi:MAG: nucleotidyltransferase family protein [Alphaproteobacteria bacterium]|nr:nucleotidyltransferase family protein [Alphaproteobacteria bacterium]
MSPEAIMIFAAGFGTRMGALTRTLPKPLIKVGEASLLDRALGLAADAKIGRVVVNTHYLAEKIVQHLADRPDILLSHEQGEALETGGGLKRALGLLQSDPVFTLNPDVVWSGPNPLLELAASWQPENMDALLMLVPQTPGQNHAGQGDFSMDHVGRLTRFRGQKEASYIFTGAQIIGTGLLAQVADERFSLNLVWDQMIACGRLFGVVHAGGWVDVGTPAGIAAAEAMLGARDV